MTNNQEAGEGQTNTNWKLEHAIAHLQECVSRLSIQTGGFGAIETIFVALQAAEKKIAEQEPLVLFTKRLYARLCDGSLSLAEWADDYEIDEIAHYKEGDEVLRKTCNDRNHKGLDILIARHGLGQSLENTDDYGQDVALLAMLLSNRDDSSAP